MASSVVKGQAANKLRVGGGAMLHLHNFNHVEIWLSGGFVNGKDGVDDIRGKFLGESGVELC
jgi:hypothetical protein